MVKLKCGIRGDAICMLVFQGFLDIDNGGRKLGIKEMGQLNEKVFQIACLAKLPPEEVGEASYELYSSWQKQLSDLSWNPFKTITVDGNGKVCHSLFKGSVVPNSLCLIDCQD